MTTERIDGMVNISDKPSTKRIAKASATIYIKSSILEMIRDNKIAKGNVLEHARVAGIMAGKKTSDLLPLCHPLPIDSITISYELTDESVIIYTTAQSVGKTGVEMEALVTASNAALTIYDMCKMYDKSMEIGRIVLLEKEGGKSGHYIRKDTGK